MMLFAQRKKKKNHSLTVIYIFFKDKNNSFDKCNITNVKHDDV